MNRKSSSSRKKGNSRLDTSLADSSSKSLRTESNAGKRGERAMSRSPSKSPAKSRSPSKRAESRADSRAETTASKRSGGAAHNSLARAIASRRKSAKSAKTVQSWRTDFSVSSNSELDDFSGQGLTNLSLKIFQSKQLF